MAYECKKDYSIQRDTDDAKQEKLARDRYINEGGSLEWINYPLDADLYLSGFYSYKDSQQAKSAVQERDKTGKMAAGLRQWVKRVYERFVAWSRTLKREMRSH